jgi:hypothetical protein
MNTIKTTPKDFFLHLGVTVSLYIAVISLLNLSFTVINYYFPDNLAGYFSASSVSWPVSIIIVLFPIAFFLKKIVTKDIILDPTKKDIWINKWRIYLSIFLTGATIVTDLIVLINTYLGGEISTRFVLKIITIFIISGILFTLFLFERGSNENKKTLKIVLKCVMGIIILTILVLGFISVGSPTKQRNLRFDNQRVSDLSNIQWQIVYYWQQKEKLPVTLSEMNDSISGRIIPVDPETKGDYQYSIKGDKKFELCANFSLKYEDMSGRGSYNGSYISPYAIDMSYPNINTNDNWKHEAGRSCFERTIDPEKYPPIKTIPANK